MNNNHHGKLIASVIRVLGDSRPVTSFVIPQSEDKEVDDQIHYLVSKGKEHIEDFTGKFVEFKRATWYIDVIEEMTGTMVESETIIFNQPVKS